MRRAAMLILLLVAACDPGIVPDPEIAASSCTPAEVVPLAGFEGHVVGLNAYYLQEEASRALRRGETSSAVVEEVMGKAAALGVRVLRTNAFNDDPAKAGDSAMQVAPLQYDEVSLRGLDLVLARARAHGLKLILPLGNYWDDYGGARQYAIWAGLDSPLEGDPRFFTEARVVSMYRAHVERLLSRVDTVDGFRYGEHPAVLAWELLNEPRGTGLDEDGRLMRAWVDLVAADVKRLAPGHLVGTGEEGFDAPVDPIERWIWSAGAPWVLQGGSSFSLNLASPWIDYGSVHVYPEAWGAAREWLAGAGSHWIDVHARVARDLGKPLVVGEFGLARDGALPLEVRRAVYAGWFRCARVAGAAMAAPWGFANDGRPSEWDAHTFYWKDGTDPADPVNQYADLVRTAALP